MTEQITISTALIQKMVSVANTHVPKAKGATKFANMFIDSDNDYKEILDASNEDLPTSDTQHPIYDLKGMTIPKGGVIDMVYHVPVNASDRGNRWGLYGGELIGYIYLVIVDHKTVEFDKEM